MRVYRGPPYQKGHGLGGIFRSIFRIAAPIIKNVGKSALKSVGRQAFRSGRDLAADLIQGKSFKESVKRRGKEGLKKSVLSILRPGKRKQIESGLVGPVKKRQKKNIGKNRPKKQKRRMKTHHSRDIFN